MRSNRKFHSWISIARERKDWSGNCRCPRKVFANCDNFADIFYGPKTGEWRISGDCFVNGLSGFLWAKRALTSILRITVEFRFVEHCSETSKSPNCCWSFFFIFGEQQKPTKIGYFWFLLLSSDSFFPHLQSFCSRIQFIDMDMIHQWSSVIFFSSPFDGIFFAF